MWETLRNFWESTGIAVGTASPESLIRYLIMYVIIGVLLYLAIAKRFEPMLLLPIAFGMLLANLPAQPGEMLIHTEWFLVDHPDYGYIMQNGGLLDLLYIGVKTGIYPSLIFLGIGAMTDFTPLIANPKSLLLGAAAQMGVFIAFSGAILFGFSEAAAAAIGIIGGADGPTAILVTKTLSPSLLPAIAIAAYSYMALIPIIQPPIMKLVTTKKERAIRMTTLRNVSKTEKILFPILVTAIVCLILPSAAPLVGFLMLGNLFQVTGVVDRLSKTAQNELINVVTIFLGVSVGATASAEMFLRGTTLLIIVLGLLAFCFSTLGGLLGGKLLCKLTRGRINPLIGSAGVSAVPMAARVAQQIGQREDPSNFLLMHAMGPNVAGVIGSAVAAGWFLSCFAR